MTYGRPSMTSHVSPIYKVPLPAMRPELQINDPCHLSRQACDHELGYMTFYVSTIELYKILESILSDVYNAWQSRSNHRPVSLQGASQSSLDMIMELDDRLSTYELNVPAVLNWTRSLPPNTSHDHQNPVFQRQRNVLRARYCNRFPFKTLTHYNQIHSPPSPLVPTDVHTALFRRAHRLNASI